MQRRKVSCLDSYLDVLQLQLMPRLRTVLQANVQSLQKAHQQALLVPTNAHPHLVTRRYAELAASLYSLSTPEQGAGHLPEKDKEMLEAPLQAMQQEVCTLLKSMASKLDSAGDPNNGQIFLVNNYDLVLTVFHERHLPHTAKAAFEALLRDEVVTFIENTLDRHYPDLITFVKNTEPKVTDLSETGRAGQQGVPPGVDVQKMEQVVRQFGQNWQTAMDKIHHYVMQSFTNFSNGMEILKQALTQLLLYWTRLQKVIDKSFPQQRPAFALELVPNSTILQKIKEYSRTF